ncbi:50S ribosomal protein L16 [Methanonatronarchaeum sp. AMET6-2]|uniref:50S ribosomal protein L16 n=1 Tax=Methanonatronarchaeum sp. AMET6-2 TaxID=2933293 RepID=UPI0011F8DE5B|nr:50S ribosomal protein L16 [Methanonatronarchaeum sp. AMET6-2]RZN63058.1 MAG: 50S ribosomal protein L16 [Methanonatronarchaeia archaeon]UOY09608.1 50S ribosomal protein L16 [Methanonatronarchaeum sp. AMET6-2]
MGEKFGKMYRQVKGQAYTRKEYMSGVPGNKIVSFDMGNKDEKDSFPIQMSLESGEKVQISHNSLESARIAANSYLNKNLGPSNYFLKLRVYPHHVLRENKMATGAGADRVQDGMRLAFGSPVGTAARIDSGQKIFSARVNPGDYKHARKALKRAVMKLPTPGKVVFDEGQELIG